MRLAGLLIATIAITSLAGCESYRNRTPSLLNVKSNTEGPDEFAIQPNKPLEIPEGIESQALPAPTVGGANRADATPLQDATIALGGNPAGGIRDNGLINYASRYGVTPNIRENLAEEDLEFRRKNDGRLLERVFNVNVYFKAYAKQSLDQYAELERMRRLGIRTSSVPPEGLEVDD